MRILIVGDDDGERRQAVSTLQGAGHVVRAASDDRSAMPALQQEAPQLAVALVSKPSESALARIRLLRENARQAALHLWLLGPTLPDEFLADAYAAGLDGELRSPFSPAYLLARVDAVNRQLGGGNPKPKAAAPQTPGAPAARNGSSALDLILCSAPWQGAAKQMESVASKFLTLAVTTKPAPSADTPLSVACRITLSSVKHQLEIRIAVGADDASAKGLVVHLFGAEDENLVADMIGEIANNFMGSLKAQFSAASLPFTGSLPEAITPDQVLRPSTTYQVQEAFALQMADARLVVHVGLRSKGNLSVSVDALREGMVLAKDLFNAKGLLLVNGGTRLSLNMIERLRGVLAAKQPIEVMTT
jgi:DNA-binding response OmpR family regulator